MLKNLSLLAFIGLIGYSTYTYSIKSPSKTTVRYSQAQKPIMTRDQYCNVLGQFAERISSARDQGYTIYTVWTVVLPSVKNATRGMNLVRASKFEELMRSVVMWVYTREAKTPTNYIGQRLYYPCLGGDGSLYAVLGKR